MYIWFCYTTVRSEIGKMFPKTEASVVDMILETCHWDKEKSISTLVSMGQKKTAVRPQASPKKAAAKPQASPRKTTTAASVSNHKEMGCVTFLIASIYIQLHSWLHSIKFLLQFWAIPWRWRFAWCGGTLKNSFNDSLCDRPERFVGYSLVSGYSSEKNCERWDSVSMFQIGWLSVVWSQRTVNVETPSHLSQFFSELQLFTKEYPTDLFRSTTWWTIKTIL